MPGASLQAPTLSAIDAPESAPLIADGFSESERERIAAVSAIVEREASATGLDVDLIYAVIWVESRFNPKAKSPAGARGLMQLMPATAAHLAKELGERRPQAYDPDFNIRAGAYYLDRLIDRFDGDETLAIAAYNAGPGNVSKWQAAQSELPDYSKDYVAKVSAARLRFAGQKTDPAILAPRMEETDASPKVLLVQRPKQRVEPVTTRQAIAHQERQLVPEPVEVFDEPIFEPSPDLDSQDASSASHLRVAVSDAAGRWPTHALPEADKTPDAPEARVAAPAASKPAPDEGSLPALETEALPGLDDELGASTP